MSTFIILDSGSYVTDTDEQIAVARAAVRDAGLDYAIVWYGDPACPDAYRGDAKLFAADRDGPGLVDEGACDR